jgi:hypothetical protein
LNLSHVREKLTEAYLFLAKMIERERQLTGEPFTSYLNALLLAAMAARDPFDSKAVRDWRQKWEKSLTPDQARIYDAMREARKDEAHIGRKSRPAKPRRRAKAFKLCVEQEEIRVGVGSPYSDRSGRVEGYGSPAIRLALFGARMACRPLRPVRPDSGLLGRGVATNPRGTLRVCGADSTKDGFHRQ